MGYRPIDKPEINYTPPSNIHNRIVTGNTALTSIITSYIAFSGLTNIGSGAYLYDGNGNIRSISADTNFHLSTTVAAGTGSTTANTIGIHLASAITIGNLTVTGITLTNVLSGNSISGLTYYSGSTPLQTIIYNLITGNTTSVNTTIGPGLNTYTGGTSTFQNVNISAATLASLSVSGNTILKAISGTSLNITGTTTTGALTSTGTVQGNIVSATSSVLQGGQNVVVNGFNLSTGTEIFRDKTISTLNFKTLYAVGNTYLSNTSSGVTIHTPLLGSDIWQQGYSSQYSIVAKNYTNYLTRSNYSLVAGNNNQMRFSNYGSILNGQNNYILSADTSNILGGRSGYITRSKQSSILNGYGVNITSSNYSYNYNTLLNGVANSMNDSQYSMIGSTHHSFINKGINSFIMGGYAHTLKYNINSSIIGGYQNTLSGATFNNSNSIINGYKSKIYNSNHSSILNGYTSTIKDSTKGAIINGSYTTLDRGNYTTIIGGNGATYNISGAGYYSSNILIGNLFLKGIPSGAQTYTIQADSNGKVFKTIVSGGSGGGSNIPGLNTYTAGTASAQSINVSALTIDHLTVSGVTSLGSLTATTFVSGTTNLYNIFSTTDTNDITRVQPGSNILTGGTANNPIVSLNSAVTISSLSASSISGLTFYSGITPFSSIFATPGQIINYQPQIDTKLTKSGDTWTNTIRGDALSATTLSGGTIYSGSTPLSTVINNIVNGKFVVYTGGTATGSIIPTLSLGNSIKIGSDNSTIAGGILNVVFSGSNNSFIGGGSGNTIQVNTKNSGIGAGRDNLNSQAHHSFIGGGRGNSNYGKYNFIGAGRFNRNEGTYSSIVGGYLNNIKPGAQYSAILTGNRNNVYAVNNSLILNGNTNYILSNTCTIIGGFNNFLSTTSEYSLMGGSTNALSYSKYSTVLNGKNNSIYNSYHTSVLLGRYNTTSYANYSSILAGANNSISNSTASAIIGSGITLSQDKTLSINRLRHNGGIQSKVTVVDNVNSPFTATLDDYIIAADTTSASVTITLPASPIDGQIYYIKQAKGNLVAKTVTIDGNGNNIDGNATITITIVLSTYILAYSSTIGQWMILSST